MKVRCSQTFAANSLFKCHLLSFCYKKIPSTPATSYNRQKCISSLYYTHICV